LWYGCSQLGLVYVPVIHIYGHVELEFILRDSGAKALVIPDRWRSIDYLERLDGLGDLPALQQVVVIGEKAPKDCVLWDDILGRATANQSGRLDAENHKVRTSAPCLLLYTSGTTSKPKGVVHTSDSYLAEAWTSFPALYRGPSAITLDVSPAGHMSAIVGVTRSILTHQNTTIFIDAWQADRALDLIQTYGVTSSGGPPFFLQTLLDAAGDDRSVVGSVHDWMLGGSAVPVTLCHRAEEAGLTTYRCYGSTEHPTVSTGLPTDSFEQRTTTDGRLLPGSSVRIVDEDGQDLPVGEEGEILTVGPEQMARYTDPDEYEAGFDSSGYFHTGDVGALTPDGFLRLTGRKKDIIIRGGENLSALEIEEILLDHPAVAESAAIAVPDAIYTERVCAVVSLRPGASLTLADVRRHFASSGVAKQKTPERLVILPELPHTPNGKVKKQQLKDELAKS
jgi:cyclohexanecarboxylate-CoA ligase